MKGKRVSWLCSKHTELCQISHSGESLDISFRGSIMPYSYSYSCDQVVSQSIPSCSR